MGFGNSQQSSGGGGNGEKEISFERRDLVFVNQEEKSTSSGKVYWRVKDTNGKFYSIWEASLLAQLQDLQGENNTPVPCVVKKERMPDGKTFYGISGCGPDADGVAAAGNQQAQSSRAPGGKNSEFGKRMHPDDALRVTNLALMERSLHLLEITVDDRPEGTKRIDYIKGNFLGVMQFLGAMCELPKTATPDAPAPKTEESPATQGFGSNPISTDIDDDIPF